MPGFKSKGNTPDSGRSHNLLVLILTSTTVLNIISTMMALSYQQRLIVCVMEQRVPALGHLHHAHRNNSSWKSCTCVETLCCSSRWAFLSCSNCTRWSACFSSCRWYRRPHLLEQRHRKGLGTRQCHWRQPPFARISPSALLRLNDCSYALVRSESFNIKCWGTLVNETRAGRALHQRLRSRTESRTFVAHNSCICPAVYEKPTERQELLYVAVRKCAMSAKYFLHSHQAPYTCGASKISYARTSWQHVWPQSPVIHWQLCWKRESSYCRDLWDPSS